MAIIFTTPDDDRQRYDFTLGESNIVTTSTYELYDLVTANQSEQLIIIGPSVKMETGKAIAEHFRLIKPSLGVLLLRKRLDVTTLGEALRSGIREVVSSDDAGALVSAAKRSRAISAQMESTNRSSESGINRGKVLVVFSAKGGCGKTTLSVNLAQSLAKYTNSRVALLDFDLQFGDVAVALQLEPKKTISDAINMQASLDELGINSLMTKKDDNFDILLAPTNPTDIEYISGDLVDNLITSLRASYDYIVVDTAPAFTDVILKVLDQADKCFLLTTLDMPAIKNLKVVINTLEALNINKSKLAFVLNRSDQETGLSISELEDMVGETFIANIPSNNAVSLSTNRGVPLVVSDPKNPVSREIIELAKKTDQIFRPTAEKQKSFFGRGK
jgi:pilus assembly protein CpaE